MDFVDYIPKNNINFRIIFQKKCTTSLRNDMGQLWENFFISERIKRNHYMGYHCNMYFWRTTSQQEIDYIEESDGMMSAFEMKWNPKKGNTKFPESFLKAYDIKETAIVTPDNYLDWLI